MAKKKSDYWLITARVDVVKKVVFDERVSVEEAVLRFKDREYEDVLDEDEIGVCEVLQAVPMRSAE